MSLQQVKPGKGFFFPLGSIEYQLISVKAEVESLNTSMSYTGHIQSLPTAWFYLHLCV